MTLTRESFRELFRVYPKFEKDQFSKYCYSYLENPKQMFLCFYLYFFNKKTKKLNI